jgi:hypothetical protein
MGDGFFPLHAAAAMFCGCTADHDSVMCRHFRTTPAGTSILATL